MKPFLSLLLRLCLALLMLFPAGSYARASDPWASVKQTALSAYGPNAQEIHQELRSAENAGIPPEQVMNLLSRASGAALTADDVARLLHPIIRAKKENFPSESFVDKALEGIAKGAPAPLIESVLDRKLATYGSAAEILGKTADRKTLEATALSLERGVRPEIMKEIASLDSRSPGTMVHASQALADLTELGFPQELGVKLVTAGIQSGYLRSESGSFVEIAARAHKLGYSAAEITGAMESQLKRGRPLSDLLTEIRGKAGFGGPRSGFGASDSSLRGRGGQGRGGQGR